MDVHKRRDVLRAGGVVIGSLFVGGTAAGCGADGAPVPGETSPRASASGSSQAAPVSALPTPARNLSRRFGPVTIVALEDADGRFFQSRLEAFPDATPTQWERADAADPKAEYNGAWWLRIRCYAVVFDDGTTVLVDAGVGPAGSPASQWAPGPGKLPDRLAEAGIAPEDVDTVILTHLHDDHIGWAVVHDEPFFPNAKYVLQQTEHDRAGGTGLSTVIKPLKKVDQLWLVDGETPVAGDLRVVATPGHTPGHQSVIFDDDTAPVALTGDVLVHVVQLADPEISYLHESDKEQARSTRRSLLAELTQRQAVLATPHLGEPFVQLPADI